jgi:transposase
VLGGVGEAGDQPTVVVDQAQLPVHHHVDAARAGLDLSKASRVGVDETSARRGHDYVWLSTWTPQAQVVFATEGRDHTTVERSAADLRAHGGDPAQARDVSADMSPRSTRACGPASPRRT